MSTSSTRTSSALYRRNRRTTLSRSTVCHLCGEEGATTVDHLIPYATAMAVGWTPAQADAVDNLAACCAACNFSRGTKPLPGERLDAA